MSAVPLSLTTYTVAPRLRAGAHPAAVHPDGTAAAIEELEGVGTTLFIDLTVQGELEAYTHLLRRALHTRHAIPDMDVATVPAMVATLDAIDDELVSGGSVYVHCFGGLGRTGTVVGCWMRRHGRDTGDPVADIAVLRRSVHTGWMRSPQTDAQRHLVRGWGPGQ